MLSYDHLLRVAAGLRDDPASVRKFIYARLPDSVHLDKSSLTRMEVAALRMIKAQLYPEAVSSTAPKSGRDPTAPSRTTTTKVTSSGKKSKQVSDDDSDSSSSEPPEYRRTPPRTVSTMMRVAKRKAPSPTSVSEEEEEEEETSRTGNKRPKRASAPLQGAMVIDDDDEEDEEIEQLDYYAALARDRQRESISVDFINSLINEREADEMRAALGDLVEFETETAQQRLELLMRAIFASAYDVLTIDVALEISDLNKSVRSIKPGLFAERESIAERVLKKMARDLNDFMRGYPVQRMSSYKIELAAAAAPSSSSSSSKQHAIDDAEKGKHRRWLYPTWSEISENRAVGVKSVWEWFDAFTVELEAKRHVELNEYTRGDHENQLLLLHSIWLMVSAILHTPELAGSVNFWTNEFRLTEEDTLDFRHMLDKLSEMASLPTYWKGVITPGPDATAEESSGPYLQYLQKAMADHLAKVDLEDDITLEHDSKTLGVQTAVNGKLVQTWILPVSRKWQEGILKKRIKRFHEDHLDYLYVTLSSRFRHAAQFSAATRPRFSMDIYVRSLWEYFFKRDLLPDNTFGPRDTQQDIHHLPKGFSKEYLTRILIENVGEVRKILKDADRFKGFQRDASDMIEEWKIMSQLEPDDQRVDSRNNLQLIKLRSDHAFLRRLIADQLGDYFATVYCQLVAAGR